MMNLTLQQLSEFDGSDASKPILVAIRGKIYDVTEGRNFHGPGAPYHFCAGKEFARAIALEKADETECTADLNGLDGTQLQNLAAWESKLAAKYPVVGEVTPGM